MILLQLMENWKRMLCRLFAVATRSYLGGSVNKFVEGLRMTHNTDANPTITTEKRHMTETEGG